MGKTIIVANRHDGMTAAIMKKMPDAIVSPNFDVEIDQGDTLCWLPLPGDPVDEEVQELATLIDHSVFLPTKIIMLSLPGTADDTSEDELVNWYGKKVIGWLMAHQYAIKMIDEFEIPYTIIRTPLIINHETTVEIVDEGKPLSSREIGLPQLVTLITEVIKSQRYQNRSIGIAKKGS
ncbi:saccharopine dehydrogenase related protein [Lactobacillaceae bacterium 24-114]